MACAPAVTRLSPARHPAVSSALYAGRMPHPPARNWTPPDLDAAAPLGYHGVTSRTDVLYATSKRWAGGAINTPARGHHGESRMATANYMAGARPAATHLPPVRVTAISSSYHRRSSCVVVMAAHMSAAHPTSRSGHGTPGASRAGARRMPWSVLGAGHGHRRPDGLVGVAGSRAGDVSRGARPACTFGSFSPLLLPAGRLGLASCRQGSSRP